MMETDKQSNKGEDTMDEQKMQNQLAQCDQRLTALLEEHFSLTGKLAESKTDPQKLMTLIKKHKDGAQQSAARVMDKLLEETQHVLAERYLKKNLFLIGFMGAGKSTVSQMLQQLYGFEVLEMDQWIAGKNGMSISEIFEIHGEEYFRQEETDLLKSCQNQTGLVVSCGGGAALRKANVEAMKENGCIVLLQAKPQTILERVLESHDRPLLENNKNVEFIAEMMGKREQAYLDAADLIVDTDEKSAEQICAEILKQASLI